MADEFASPTGINWHGTVGTVQYGGGAGGQVVKFYNRSVLNPVKSRELGYPVHEDKVHVEVFHPGEQRYNIVDRPATGQDARLWPMQWAQFQQNKPQVTEGMPIDLLYPDKPSVASTLRANGVHTVEQCAKLSGSAIDSIGMGAQTWVNAAQQLLQMANKGVGATQFRTEMEEKDRQIRVLTRQVESLVEEVKQLRSTSTTSANLEAIQQLLAGAMTRPVMPQQPGKRFDVAAEQIAATHVTNQLKPKREPIRR